MRLPAWFMTRRSSPTGRTTMRNVALPAFLLAFAIAACGFGAATAQGNATDLTPTARYATRFAGVPPQGTRASTPVTGKLMLSFGVLNLTWNVYADGRVIWQTWTPAGD